MSHPVNLTFCLSVLLFLLIQLAWSKSRNSGSSDQLTNFLPNHDSKLDSKEKRCSIGWKEIHGRIEYVPGSGQRVLFPEAELSTCESRCEPKKISTRLTLATHHIGKGCDRDTYSVESQRKLCGASTESVDLLPTPGSSSLDWSRDVPVDSGAESDQIYEFDGSTNAVVIPESTLTHNLSNKFTISFWMKHESPLLKGGQGQGSSDGNKHLKEHILCNADDHKKNRHHYSLFVRNCRLILLLRREFEEESKHTTFRPAEWRWKLNEVCENEWHHFAVSVNFPEVTLFVDGSRLKETANNPEIVDDWPLHSVKGVNTTLVVGACWEGRDSRMKYHFHGFLAGLSILRGRNESPEVLSCLHECKEGLKLPSSDSLDPGTDVSINSDSTTIFIEGNDSIDIEDILSQISYINSRQFPTPGRRSLRLTTSIKCTSGKVMKVPPVDSYLVVLPPEQPSIAVNGTSNLAREYESFIQGIELFSTVSLVVNNEPEVISEAPEEGDWNDERRRNSVDSDESSSNDENDEDERIELREAKKLDSCTVQVYPPLNPDHEYFRLPVNYMSHLGIHYKETKDGLVIHGADMIHSYQTILRQVVYFNRKPAFYLNRAFKLSCSELNGRFKSNDYIQTLTVIHPKATNPPPVLASTTTVPTTTVPTVTVPSTGQIGDSSKKSPLNHIPMNDDSHLLNEPFSSPSHLLNDDSHLLNEPFPARAQIHDHRVQIKDSNIKSSPVSAGFLDSGLMDAGDAFARTSVNTRNQEHLSPIVVGHAVTVIIVVCVGFLVFMIVLGVIRIRAAHHRTIGSNHRTGNGGNPSDEDQELAWDDTALTITVNPLDQLDGSDGETTLNNHSTHSHDDESDSSSNESYHEDDSSDEDGIILTETTLSASNAKNKDNLVWDDSALGY